MPNFLGYTLKYGAWRRPKLTRKRQLALVNEVFRGKLTDLSEEQLTMLVSDVCALTTESPSRSLETKAHRLRLVLRHRISKRAKAIAEMAEEEDDLAILEDVYSNLDRDVQTYFCQCGPPKGDPLLVIEDAGSSMFPAGHESDCRYANKAR